VLEHVEDDRAALKAIAQRLRPGGTILITVPQHPWMWSGHDVANHHFRRYTKATLRAAIADAGLQLTMLASFNSLLFPLAAAARLLAKMTGRQGSDDALPPAPVNALFEKIFGLERYLVGRVPMPPGVSLIAVVSAR
jgi:SAM-dependent methyltransferase